MSAPAYYETEQALSEYLLFHYGTPEQVLPWPFGPATAQSDVMDAQYQRDAARLAERIRDKRDGS